MAPPPPSRPARPPRPGRKSARPSRPRRKPARSTRKRGSPPPSPGPQLAPAAAPQLGGEALPAVLFPGATSGERKRLAELRARKRIRRVGPRLYVSVPPAQVARTLQQVWPAIAARLFPDGLITHRTALEYRPSPDGEIFITGRTRRDVRYPGLTLRFLRGPGPLPDDPPFMRLRASSLARAFLENLSPRAAARGQALPIAEIEERLEKILRLGGEAELNRLRDRARQIARQLGWAEALARLEGLIGTLLGTRAEPLASPVARARAEGAPFDPACFERLQLLFAEVRGPLPERPDTFAAPDHFTNKAFFEAYFSNFIEGTIFEIAEAEEIVFDKRIPAQRPKDAHDIVGTFEIVASRAEMSRTPRDLEELLALLIDRHGIMLSRRPEAAPGEFKTRPNRAGDTEFVHPDYVRGTLAKGMELYRDLRPGLPRAIFMMFLVTDVHPFVDGNGRIARIMMNAELQAAGQATIIIPTVFRDDYLQAQRALTRRHRPAPLVNALVKAQAASHLEFSPYPRVLDELIRRSWFREPDSARLQ